MNPWALVIIGIGIMLVIVGVKGTQHNLVPAITGKKSGNTSAPAAPPTGMA